MPVLSMWEVLAEDPQDWQLAAEKFSLSEWRGQTKLAKDQTWGKACMQGADEAENAQKGGALQPLPLSEF